MIVCLGKKLAKVFFPSDASFDDVEAPVIDRPAKPPYEDVAGDALPSEIARDLLLFDQALASTSCGVTLADAGRPGYPLIYANQAFVELTGFPLDEVLGRNCRFLQAEDRDQPNLKEIRSLLAEEGHGEFVLRNYRKDGTMFWNELTLSPIYTDGELTHYVGIQNDVSVREQNRLERRRLIGELEQARHAFEQHARMVAEHMEGPFGALRRQCESLRDGPLTRVHSPLGEALADLSLTTQELEKIAQRLGEYTGMHPVVSEFERIAIRELVEEIVTSLEAPAGIAWTYPDADVFIFSRRDRLRDIFRPLLKNAIQHGAPDGSIAVGCQESGSVLRFWVSDDGPGISGEDQGRIFDLFETAPSSDDTPEHRGVGMGLSLAKRAVESLRGRIWVGSVPDHGAIFFFELPR